MQFSEFNFPGAGDSEAVDADETQPLEPFRKAFKGTVIAAGGFNKETAERELEKKAADLITFGRYWLANPDLPVSTSFSLESVQLAALFISKCREQSLIRNYQCADHI